MNLRARENFFLKISSNKNSEEKVQWMIRDFAQFQSPRSTDI